VSAAAPSVVAREFTVLRQSDALVCDRYPAGGPRCGRLVAVGRLDGSHPTLQDYLDAAARHVESAHP
jgi:hypothetical protein